MHPVERNLAIARVFPASFASFRDFTYLQRTWTRTNRPVTEQAGNTHARRHKKLVSLVISRVLWVLCLSKPSPSDPSRPSNSSLLRALQGERQRLIVRAQCCRHLHAGSTDAIHLQNAVELLGVHGANETGPQGLIIQHN